jgi:hypothetical protein
MQSLTIATAIILAVPASVGAGPPQLQPRVILPGEGVAGPFWRLAPNIGIVTIDSARRVGPDVDVTPGKLAVHLVEVKGEVENALQGELVPGPVRFYFFTNTLVADVGYTTPLLWFQPGCRYAVFLRDDGGVLRTMADLTDPSIRIQSGRHDGYSTAPEDPTRRDPGAAIAALALTPNADHDKGFAVGIEETYDRLLLIVSPGQLAPPLRRLLAHPDQEVREHACLVLSIHYSYTDPCFEGLLESSDAALRRQANSWAPRKRASEHGLPTALKDDPTSLSISKRVEDLAGDLELFSFDRDPEVRRQACDALHRLFPLRTFPNCSISSAIGARKQ